MHMNRKKCDSEHYLRLQTMNASTYIHTLKRRLSHVHKAADNKNDNVIVRMRINVFPKRIYFASSEHPNIHISHKLQTNRIIRQLQYKKTCFEQYAEHIYYVTLYYMCFKTIISRSFSRLNLNVKEQNLWSLFKYLRMNVSFSSLSHSKIQ